MKETPRKVFKKDVTKSKVTNRQFPVRWCISLKVCARVCTGEPMLDAAAGS